MIDQFSISKNQIPHRRPPHLPRGRKTTAVRTDRELLRTYEVAYAHADNAVTELCLTSTFAP